MRVVVSAVQRVCSKRSFVFEEQSDKTLLQIFTMPISDGEVVSLILRNPSQVHLEELSEKVGRAVKHLEQEKRHKVGAAFEFE